jgi:small multidrug resistance pump
MPWLTLAGAIGCEVAATLALRAAVHGLRPLTVLLVVCGYPLSFLLMVVALRTLDVGVAYAVWSGVGTAGVALVAAWFYDERLNPAAVVGMLLIVLGVVVLASSGSTGHL